MYSGGELPISAGVPTGFGKDLVAASSVPIVLSILASGDSYGYAILQRVRALSGGQIRWTDGMLYPVLHRLEREGCVEASWTTANGRRRKYYRITPTGRAHLFLERERWRIVDRALRAAWQAARGPVGALARRGEAGA